MTFAECLPTEISHIASASGLRELRLRNFHCARANVEGRWFWVGAKGLVSASSQAVCLGDVCDAFVRRACNSSVYAYEKMLAQGFFTMSEGVRIGVCGVMGGGGVFQKYTSLCIRVPRSVECVTGTFDGSIVVAGPPRSGKTTYLRDLAAKLSSHCNVAVVDERGEIACCNFSETVCCDVLSFADKQYAFEVAVRSMSPDWLICDELAQCELPLLQNVTASGVRLAASIHADSPSQLKQRLGKYADCFKYAIFLQKDTFAQTIAKLSNL